MTKLFNENLGIASNRIELDKLRRKFNQYDPSYVAISTMTTRPEFREELEVLWKQYEPYADSNFPNEFKKQFNQRAWELHIGSTLLNRGYALGVHSDSGPDFRISHKNKDVWIEAVAIEKGKGKDKVPDIEDGKAMDVPEQEMLLRLTAGLIEKHRKYLSYLKNNNVSKDDPFIIAIDRSPLDHPDAQIPLILKCLFAIGHQILFLKGTKT
jgi:type I restriction enzyme S subunit